MFKLIFKILDKFKGFLGALGVFGITMYYIVVLGLLVGYFVNIYKLIFFAMNQQSFEITLMLVLRIVGIFMGILGGIVGWL